MIPLLIILFLVGAITGSFLNVVIYRLPRGMSIVAPGSRCPRCEQPVQWYDNIPMLSYILLRGQCRSCGEPITMRYPTVELLTAVLWAAAGIRFGYEWSLLPALFLFSVLVAVYYIDLDHYIIPNVIVLPAAVIGLAANIAIAPDRWLELIAAGLASAGFFFIIAITVPGGMGMGDVKLAGMLGFFLGKTVLVALFLGFAFGAITGVVLMAAGIKGRKSRIPFGPFLAGGAVIATLYGDRLLDLWTNLFQQ